MVAIAAMAKELPGAQVQALGSVPQLVAKMAGLLNLILECVCEIQHILEGSQNKSCSLSRGELNDLYPLQCHFVGSWGQLPQLFSWNWGTLWD